MKEMVGAILGYKAEALGEDASIDRINHQIVHNADEGWMPILVHEDKIIFERWRDIIVADDANEAFSTRKFTRRILRPLPIYGNSRPDLSNGDVFTIIMAHHDADESMQPGEFIELLDLTMDPWMLGKIMYVEYLPFKNISQEYVQMSLASKCGFIPKTATIEVIQNGLFRLIGGGADFSMEDLGLVIGIKTIELYI